MQQNFNIVDMGYKGLHAYANLPPQNFSQSFKGAHTLDLAHARDIAALKSANERLEEPTARLYAYVCSNISRANQKFEVV